MRLPAGMTTAADAHPARGGLCSRYAESAQPGDPSQPGSARFTDVGTGTVVVTCGAGHVLGREAADRTHDVV
jgi:hypothetical protein